LIIGTLRSLKYIAFTGKKFWILHKITSSPVTVQTRKTKLFKRVNNTTSETLKSLYSLCYAGIKISYMKFKIKFHVQDV